MSLTKTLFALAALVQASIAGYVLQDNYAPSNFFNEFDFFTGPDPTEGFVDYVSQGEAQARGLISTKPHSVYMGVDTANVSQSGRASVRITSKKVYNHGLIVLDATHMPEGCGTWPAFWTMGPDWPTHGEIDIIEGVNSQKFNAMTMHTGPGCSIGNNVDMIGAIQTNNCDVNDPNQPNNAGCSIDNADTGSFGAGFNAGHGGVYAMDWTSQYINIYFFPRSKIPKDIKRGSPNPATWGPPQASFSGGCDLDSTVQEQQIVFDTTFCGTWAGGAWNSDSTCSAKGYSCSDYVANNPTAFSNANWKIKSLKVYQQSGSSSLDQANVNISPGGKHRHGGAAAPAAVTSSAAVYSAVYTSWNAYGQAVPTTVVSAPSSTAYAPSSTYYPSSSTYYPPSSTYYPPSSTYYPPSSTSYYARAPTTTAVAEASYTPGAPVPSSWFPDGGEDIPAPAPMARRRVHQARLHSRKYRKDLRRFAKDMQMG